MSQSAVAKQISPLIVVIVLGFSSLCVSLMQTLVLPIQGELPKLLHTSASNASWVVTATLLGGAVAMPIAGRLADIYGKKPILLASATILMVGSLLCAVSEGLAPILTGRVLQGLAMGYIPVAISLVRDVAPPHKANSALAAVSAMLGVGGALGLPLAAWIVEAFDWRALFWVATALAGLMIVASAALLPNVADANPARFDLPGALGIATGLVAVLVGVSKGNDWGWTSPVTLTMIIGGVAVLLSWALFELRTKYPLVDLRTTAHLPVLLTNLAALLVGFGMTAHTIVVPQLLQLPTEIGHGLGQTIMQTGIWMAPAGITMLLVSPLSSMLLTRLGGRVTLAIGAGVLASGYIFATFMLSAPWQLMVAASVASAGVGIAYAAMPTLVMDNVPRAKAGSSVGVNALMRSVGSTVAGAVIAIVLTSRTVTVGEATAPALGAIQLAFVIGACAALVGLGITLLIPRAKKALTAPVAAEVKVPAAV